MGADLATQGHPRRLARVALTCLGLAAAASGCSPEVELLPPPPSPLAGLSAWPAYGGDDGGQRHAPGVRIARADVDRLALAWTYHTGDVSDGRGEFRSGTAFENTPLLFDGMLILCTPFSRVIALDPATGTERWSFDPLIDPSGRYSNQLVCRGVATWRDSRPATDLAEAASCRQRVFSATADARLIALDAQRGTPCPDFGQGGAIALASDVGPIGWLGEYQVTSPPAVAGDVVVVGSAVSDNHSTEAPSGVVRGFDARSGRLRWALDLAPPSFDHATQPVSAAGYALGTPNVWAPMAVDAHRDLVFLPTGNASPDYYRGDRAVMNHYGSSVLAVRGATGEIVWQFQTVHRDLWDFDVPAQPTLARIEVDGRERDVVIQATKMGLVFVLDRDTGEPVFGVREEPAPQDGAPGEQLSPTQPIPLRPPMLVRQRLEPGDAFGITPWDRAACRRRIAELRFDGMYTPPSLQGTLMYPGNAGGSNWGGISVDPSRQLAFVRSTDLPWAVQLIPRDAFEREKREHSGHEFAPQIGTPYGMSRTAVLSPLGLPCNPPPWGTLSAVDLRTGELRWQVPHGSVVDLLPLPLPIRWLTLGTPGIGGPMTTGGGLVFIAAALDDYLRAFDAETGEEVWRGRLPAGGQATPMAYRARFEDGSARDYVVVAAGGHARAGTRLGDAVVAFAVDVGNTAASAR